MENITDCITIVVPVKDRATLVLRTLNSIKEQSWRPLKLVVVDNGSSDGTPESVSEWIEKNTGEQFQASLVSESNPGPSSARNKGLEEVDTPYVMFFDSDDVMQPGHIGSIMKRLKAHDNPDLVCFRVNYHPINGEDKRTKRPGPDMMSTHIIHSLLRTQGYACETALVRRAGGWNTGLYCWEDLEIGSRLLMEARHKVFIDNVNVDVYARADSVTGTEFSSRRGEWEKALQKMLENFEKSRHKKRYKWLRMVLYRYVILAASYKREGKGEYAERIMSEILINPLLSDLQRFYLKLAYLYTCAGGRGAGFPANLIM